MDYTQGNGRLFAAIFSKHKLTDIRSWSKQSRLCPPKFYNYGFIRLRGEIEIADEDDVMPSFYWRRNKRVTKFTHTFSSAPLKCFFLLSEISAFVFSFTVVFGRHGGLVVGGYLSSA